MRWFWLSLLLVVLGVGAVIPASRPSAAQNKQLTTFEPGLLVGRNSAPQKNNVPPLTWDATLAVARMGINLLAQESGLAWGDGRVYAAQHPWR